MPEARNQNRRIYGNSSRSYSSSNGSGNGGYIPRDLTEEQRAERQRETQANYDNWLAARRARLSRPRLLR